MSAAELDGARETIARLFQAALAAVEPASAVQRVLCAGEDSFQVNGKTIPAAGGVHVIAVGKAAVAMTQGALAALGEQITSGDVITKEGHASVSLPPRFRVFEAGHPIPDQRGVDATRAALEALGSLPANAAVLALISGGGSALLEAPRPGLALEDFAQTTKALLNAGAPIDALNAVRAPLSLVKAGGLRRAAPALPWATLFLSDVLGNDPRVIASGPTVPGRSDPVMALEMIARFQVEEQTPAAVLASLQEPRPAQPEPTTGDDTLVIIGDNAMAVAAAAEQAAALGFACHTIWAAKEGEARELGASFAVLAGETDAETDVLLGGGEATVTVRGDGVGGRNTEFALAAALQMERDGPADWVIASLGTDGQDALTSLAGAEADAGTCARARAAGVDPIAAMQRSDSMRVFAAAGGAVATGPTGTNVNDLYIAVRRGRQVKP